MWDQFVNDAELMARHVVLVPLATLIEAEDEIHDCEVKEILAIAERNAERFPAKLCTELLRGREVGEAMVGEMIVGEAKDRGAELLIV